MRPLSVLALPLVAACTPAPPAPVGLPNPATQYCIAQGGRIEIRRDAAGAESGWCHLPDGRVVDEWALFRAENRE